MKRLFIYALLVLAVATTSANCKKNPENNNNSGKHNVDPRFVGKWMWSEAGSGAYYDDNGVYQGPSYGLATQYTINADGYGKAFNHAYSTIGAGTGLEVNISSNGFFESDDQGHLGYFPTSGTYKSSSGENRALRSDELWNEAKSTGATLYQKVEFKTIGGRECFQVTSSDGTVDTFYKVP